MYVIFTYTHLNGKRNQDCKIQLFSQIRYGFSVLYFTKVNKLNRKRILFLNSSIYFTNCIPFN